MKKVLIGFMVAVFASSVWGLGREVIQRENLSLKGGPTAPGEDLSIVWVETYVYPKVVKADRVISLGVRLTSKVEAIKVSFDFGRESVALHSSDGMQWSGAYRIPEAVSPGVHVARFNINAAKGGIQRTLNFFLETSLAKNEADEGIVFEQVGNSRGWVLTVLSDCNALVDNDIRKLKPGEKVTGISKSPWYRVIFPNGKEGWLPANKVKEPLEEYYAWGFEAYRNKKYREAIKYYKITLAIEPEQVKAYLWLAKSYFQLGEYNSSYNMIKEAIRIDNRDMGTKVFANKLAHKYYSTARAKYRANRYHEALAAYQKVLDLKPTSVNSWLELGKCYQQLGFAEEATTAWREALGINPENDELLALLNIRSAAEIKVAAAPAGQASVNKAKATEKTAQIKKLLKPKKYVAPSLADDSLKIVKKQTTRKGTKIEAALKSVLSLTKSLGTSVIEKGWEVKKRRDDFIVSYVCEQGQGMVEAFEWLVDVDSKRVTANNDNARLLMNRW